MLENIQRLRCIFRGRLISLRKVRGFKLEKHSKSYYIIGIVLLAAVVGWLGLIAINRQHLYYKVEMTRADQVQDKVVEIWVEEGIVQDGLEKIVEKYKDEVNIYIRASSKEVYEGRLQKAVQARQLPDIFYVKNKAELEELKKLNLIHTFKDGVYSIPLNFKDGTLQGLMLLSQTSEIQSEGSLKILLNIMEDLSKYIRYQEKNVIS